MDNSEQNIESMPILTEKLSLGTRISRIIGQLISGVFLFLILGMVGIYVFIQTDSFREWFRPVLIEQINKQIKGKVYFEDMRLDIFKGLILHEVTLTAAGDTVLHAGDISVSYTIEAILNRSISIGTLTLDHPTIKILRSRDGTWNLEHILYPTPEDPSKPPFDWQITLGNLEMCGGSIRIYDSLNPTPKPGIFNVSDLDIKDVNLIMSGKAFPGIHRYEVDIASFTSHDLRSGLDIRDFALNAIHSKDGITLQSCKITTAGSSLSMSGRFNDIDVFDDALSERLKKSSMSIALLSERFDTEDLRRFLPEVGIFGIYDLDLEANGTLQDITVDNLEIGSKNSRLRISGKLNDVDDAKRLFFSAESIGDSRIDYDMLVNQIPALSLPSLPYLGVVSFKSLLVKGKPSDSLHIQLDANTKSGAVQGMTNLVFRGNDLGYDGDIKFTDLNPGAVIQDKAFDGLVNMHLKIAGKGTTLPTLDANIRIDAGPSRLGEYSISSLVFDGQASEAGLIAIDTADIVFREAERGIDEFENVQRSALHISGMIDARQSNPLFDLEANCENISPSAIFNSKKLPSHFDGSLTMVMRGMHPDSLDGDMHIHARQLIFKDRTVRPQSIDVSIRRENPEVRHVRMQSAMYDIKADGRFTFLSLITAIDHTVSSVILEGEKKYKGMSGLDLTNHPLMPMMDTSTIDAKIIVNAKDLAPVNLFMEGINATGEVNMSMHVLSDKSSTTMSIDSLHALNGHIFGPDNDGASSPFFLKGYIKTEPGIDGRRILSSLNIHAKAKDWLSINDLMLKQPTLSFIMNKEDVHGEFSGSIGDDIHVDMNTDALFTDTSFRYSAKYFSLTYGQLNWKNTGPLKGTFSGTGIYIDDFNMKRVLAETISAKGKISGRVFHNLNVTLSDFPLRDVKKLPFIPNDIREVLATLKGNAKHAIITANGSFKNPVYTCNGNMDSIYYNDVAVGNQQFTLHHADSMITGSVSVTDLKSIEKRTLSIDIEQIPYNLAIDNPGKAMRSDEPLVVIAQANGLSIATIAPFIPGVTDLRGKADATITLGGYAPDGINYGGKATLKDMTFVLDATNIRYFAEGNVFLKNSTATLDSVFVRNDKLDLPNGEAIITGNLNLYDIIYIKNFDLDIISKQLLVLSDASASTMPTMYGKFIIASGEKPLRFYGTFKKPFLRGDVKVLQASITMPPEQEQLSASGVRYTVLNDDQRNLLQSRENPITDLLKALSETTNGKSAATPKSKADEGIDENELLRRKRAGFNDLLDYDLNVLMPGKFLLKMILGTFEEIRANVEPTNKQAILRFQKEAFKLPRLFGEIKLLEGSQYKFLKVFDASGTLLFNTGELTNPTLDLLAVYKGQTRYDDELENFRVIMKITGTKNLPQVAITWERNGIEAIGDSAQIRNDALMKLIVGRTQAELFGRGSGGMGTRDLGNQLSNSLSAAASQLFSGLLEGTGLLTNATISLQEGLSDLSQARLNLSGQLFSDVAWRAAGTIGDLSGNYEFSVDVPITILGDYDALRNLLLQLTRASAPANAISTRQQKEWEMKISWRYAF
jgi:hypothetical protein